MRLRLSSYYFSFIKITLAALMLFGCNFGQSNHKLLIITGGHDFEREEFFETFDELPNVVYQEVMQPEANKIYSSPEINNFDMIVFYDMVQEISEAQKKSLIDLLEDGKGMLFLHHSLASYQEWDEFEKIIGGRYYLQRDSTTPNQVSPSTYKHDVIVPVKIIDKYHTVTEGIEDFKIFDEVYGGFKVIPEVYPLLSTEHPESGQIIGWTNKYLNSHIVYIQLGHDHHAYENKNFRQLIKQSIEWISDN